MLATSTPRLSEALPAEQTHRLMRLAREVSFAPGTRVFEEGGRADHFWIVRTGTVALDLRVPGRGSPVIDTLGHGELVGWSWLFPPYVWQLGAEAVSAVEAYELDASTVRLMCQSDPALGTAVGQWVGRVLSRRLHTARTRLLDLYAPDGSGASR
ncbi:cyclic nucleotide-binding domain-containing protein [Streptomyces sp. BH-SS-21]|uniref:Cyclic nucleotide-binding domain-containing protein n=1 Tax=Streptomyces liliiviolaceus TaxID=2823109 RepID=A0A940Y4R3_9ACTN|nr:cyclic nucleotide-binding domain-containing protein [Streptomyces liliiviolaceus]MBQ0855578.1 cyclic nucleotide-binding domain-containing protein [Streptomyces liliiviolaceus]